SFNGHIINSFFNTHDRIPASCVFFIVCRKNYMTVFLPAPELFNSKTLPVTVHIPVKGGNKKSCFGKLSVTIHHFSEQLFEREMNRRTEFCIFIFGRRNTDKIFKIE